MPPTSTSSSNAGRQNRSGSASLKQGQDEILGWDLHFAQSNPGEDGGRSAVVATDRPLSFWETANQPRTVDYPFTFIQLQLNGEGRATLSVATKVLSTSDGRFVALETYDTPPVHLNDVKCR